MVCFKICMLCENGIIHHIQFSIWTFNITIRGEIVHPRILCRVKTTDMENQYKPYSRACEYGSSMLEEVYITVFCTLVASIQSLCIIIAIASTVLLIIFILDISSSFQGTISSTMNNGFILVYHISNWNSSN